MGWRTFCKALPHLLWQLSLTNTVVYVQRGQHQELRSNKGLETGCFIKALA